MGISHQSKLDENERRALQAFPVLDRNNGKPKEKPKDIASSMIDHLVARGLLITVMVWREGQQKWVAYYNRTNRAERMLNRYGTSLR